MKAIFRIFIISMITLSIFGCNSTKDKIVGKWSSKGNSVEFLKDGTFVATQGNDSGSGKWSIMDDGRLRMDVSSPLGGNQTVLSKITITDTSLTTIDESNKSETFTKIK